MQKNINIRFCGFGGQGIVLSAVIFGTTAVTRAGLNAVQMQSYGSEARGGECQAEVIVSDSPIESPLADAMDAVVAMSQPALEKFLNTLKPNGLLIIDPEFVTPPAGGNFCLKSVPATRIATDIGLKLAANMVMLGYLQAILRIFKAEDLAGVVAAQVPAQFCDQNLQAVQAGIRLGRESRPAVNGAGA